MSPRWFRAKAHEVVFHEYPAPTLGRIGISIHPPSGAARCAVSPPPFVDARHGHHAALLFERGVVSVTFRTTAIVGRRVAGGFDRDEAEEWVGDGKADLIAFGRKFLANPDLPQRFRLGADLNADDATTYYGGGAKGYTDYPSLEQERGEVIVVEPLTT